MWLLLLLGCVCEGELVVLDGDVPVPPGGSVTLEYRYRGRVEAGPNSCGAHWEVDGIPGGDADVGTVTDCGLYVAPLVVPDEDPEVLAASEEPGTCADCCPFATRTITLQR
jgi:hypothetical protein